MHAQIGDGDATGDNGKAFLVDGDATGGGDADGDANGGDLSEFHFHAKQ